MATPFLKWAGGKRWFVKNHEDLLPKKFNTYYEPFLGSAAVFFHLEPKEAVLSDANPHLIECYQAIKDDWRLVVRYLKEHQRKHEKDYYYEIRAKQFNSRFTRAAKFIYLNRTCWNGLYRENLKGIFNVPIGTKTKVLLDSDDFEETSKILSNADLNHCDFSETISKAEAGDFIFVDPPYTVAHNNNGFVKYNQNIFSWEDQERLKDNLIEAKKRGAIILLTNADHKSIEELYEKQGSQRSLDRSSVISGKNKGRSSTSELLIRI